MKEKEFIELLRINHLKDGIKTPVFWTLNDKGEVLIDIDSMKIDFKESLEVLENVENGN